MAKRPVAKRRRKASARKRKRIIRAYFLRFLLFLAALAIIFALFFGVRGLVRKITSSSASGNEVEEVVGGESETRLEFFNDGTLNETIIEPFDEDIYSEDGLRTMVTGEIDEYNSSKDEEGVGLKYLKFSKGEAILSIDYSSAEDYEGFNGEKLVFGKIADTDPSEFTGNVTAVKSGDVIGASDIPDIKGTVIILNADTTVRTPKKIKYTGRGVKLTGKKEAMTSASEDGTQIIIY